MRQEMSFCRCWLAIVVLHFIARSNFLALTNDIQRENCTNTPYIISLNSTNSVERQNSVLLTAVYTLPRVKTSALNFTTTWSAANLDNATATPQYCDIVAGLSNESLQISTVEFAYHSDNLCVLNVSANLHSIDECTEMQQLTVWFSGSSLNVAFKFSLSFQKPVGVSREISENGTQTKENSSKSLGAIEKEIQACRYKPKEPSNVYLGLRLAADNAERFSSGLSRDESSTALSTLTAYVVSCKAEALPAPSLRLTAMLANGSSIQLKAAPELSLPAPSRTQSAQNSSVRPCPTGKSTLASVTEALLDVSSLLAFDNDGSVRAQLIVQPRLLLKCTAAISGPGSSPVTTKQAVQLAELPPAKLLRQAWMSMERLADPSGGADTPQANYGGDGGNAGLKQIVSQIFLETESLVLTCRIANAPWHYPTIIQLSNSVADTRDLDDVRKQRCQNGLSSRIGSGVGVFLARAVIGSLRKADAGLYRCCASIKPASRYNKSAAASAVSSAAYLPADEVFDDAWLEVASAGPPIISNASLSTLVLTEGSTEQLRCEILNRENVPTPVTTFEWLKDGIRLDFPSNLNGTGGLLDGDSNGSFRITRANAADAGNYVCLVSNRLGSSNKTFSVRVIPRETIGLPYSSLQLILGGTLGSILAIALLLSAALLWQKRKFLRLRNSGRLINNKTDAVFIPSELQRLLIERKLTINRKRLIIGESIGSGNFSRVYRGQLRPRKGDSSSKTSGSQLIEVAIKMPSSKSDADELRYMVAELEILAKVGTHRNILKLHGALVNHSGSNTGISIVTEYCCNGSLDSFLLSHRDDFQASNCPDGTLNDDAKIDDLSTGHLLLISYQAASGLNYLSLQNIIHRDIAARNVLIAEGLVVKIADFGLSKASLTKYTSGTRSQNQPLPWLAIESITDAVFSKESDVWSFGVLLWEIFSLGSVPFADTLICGHFDEYLAAGHRLAKPAFASIELYELMSGCWDLSPKKRPPFAECMACLYELGMADFPALFESIQHCEVQEKPKAIASIYVSCGVRPVLDTRL